jgi:hypothetical protein
MSPSTGLWWKLHWSNTGLSWAVRENSAQDILALMLCMFLPACGVLSKARGIQWGVVEKEVLCLTNSGKLYRFIVEDSS